ncbi:ATP-dependent dethiobiotin synthetase BioD [Streptomyces spiroverticillatus]|uniref:ATP-dependent dethiobiotin synthetase BioD n=1 Tax=Streptomyces finlayi TaxID=67296 RepID=A0A919CD68_9ACTN|nr:dethiobiotin synthase [Streptomyces finlayi]GHA28850.1 ATP-dependent dethiobiotin synthetase BioD [Streptomyces spiroverticillatus]GHD09462.1 ATP-dependent dethiobiotin synthetase BioD [Streptomyces finlayi]
MTALVVTGTNTDIGKTVVTAAVAALARAAGRRVAVFKPAQTGVGPTEPGDAHVAARLAGEGVVPVELARFPEPLAPATSARRAGMPPVTPQAAADAVRKLEAEYDLVLVEGAGGLLVRLDDEGGTLADVAALLDAPVLVVAAPALGTLNIVQLTGEALRARGLTTRGVVIGAWPDEPGLAERCNVGELAEMAGAPLLGAVPAGAGGLDPAEFGTRASQWLAPELGGTWNAEQFTADRT